MAVASERPLSDPVTEMERFGMRVVFVADIEDCFERLMAMKADLVLVANIVGVLKFLKK